MQTNTASLDRLCTLFVLSTLLVFEHIGPTCFLLSMLVLRRSIAVVEHVGVILGMPTQIGWKTCFPSDFRNRTWIEPKPYDGQIVQRLSKMIVHFLTKA